MWAESFSKIFICTFVCIFFSKMFYLRNHFSSKIILQKNFLQNNLCHIFRTLQQSWFILTNGLPVPCSLVNINFTL